MSDASNSSGPRAVPTPEIVLATLLGDGAEHAEIGFFLYADDGRYVSANPYGAELLGLDRDELLTHDVGEFTAGGIDRSVLSRPELREGVRLVHSKDGTRVPVAFVVTPTRIASLAFYLAVVWRLDPSDPRARDAT